MSDQDDVWFPEKIERVISCFEDPRVTVVINDQILTNEKVAHHNVTRLQWGRTHNLSHLEEKWQIKLWLRVVS